jgi:pimeloyl-ACP methyl ester carboxylesterase
MPIATLNGTRLCYEIDGIGEPLLFIHGLGGSREDWELQIPAFSKQYKVITVDLRGHGRSDKPHGPYSMTMLASDVGDLLQELGVGPTHIVGVSMGGSVALQLAIDRPDVVKTLTIVNSSHEWIVRSFAHRVQLWQRILMPRLLGMRRLGEVLAKRGVVFPDHVELRAQFVARFAQNRLEAYVATVRAAVGWAVTDRLASICCPTLIIAAEHDFIPTELKRTCAALIPNARLVIIPDAHHAVPTEKPDVFNMELQQFVARQSDSVA